MPATYTCDEPPCIHVVYDERRRLVQVFIEDEDYITPIRLNMLSRACDELRRALSAGAREARGAEVDELARKYLGASPVEGETNGEK